MPRFSVNYNDVWKEVSSAEFVNIAPSTEHDCDSVRRLADLIQEALQILQNPAYLITIRLGNRSIYPNNVKEFKKQFFIIYRNFSKQETIPRN